MKFGRKENCLELSETLYEEYESSVVRRSTFVISMNTFNECILYDGNNKVVAKMKLPIDVYNEQFGLTLSYDNTKLFLQRWSTELRCYSIPDGKILWRSKLKRVNSIFSFEDLLFCDVFEKGIYIVNANTGNVVKKAIDKYGDYDVFRVSREVFCFFAENELFSFNMASEAMWKPKIGLKLKARQKQLEELNIMSNDNYHKRSYTIQNVIDLGDSISIKFFKTKIDGQNDEVILKVLKEKFIQCP